MTHATHQTLLLALSIEVHGHENGPSAIEVKRLAPSINPSSINRPALVLHASDLGLLFSHKASRFELWCRANQRNMVISSFIFYRSGNRSQPAFTVYYVPPGQRSAKVLKTFGGARLRAGDWYYRKNKARDNRVDWRAIGKKHGSYAPYDWSGL